VPAPLFERFEKQDWFFILINLQWTVTASCRRVQSDHLLNRGLQVMVQDGEMNMYVRYLCVVTMLLACAGAAAQEIDLTLSDNSALFRYLKHGTSTYGQSEIDAGLLYTNDSDFLLMLGLQVQGEAGSGSPGLNAGIGFKGFTANTDLYDLLAFGIGGELHYTPASINRLGFRVQFYHAPNIVTFMDAERLTYSTLSIEYDLLQQAKVYLGYRNVRASINGQSSIDLDDDTHLGFRIMY